MNFMDAMTLAVSALSQASLERANFTYEVLVGDENISVHGEPPRIVIVPLSSQPMNVVRQNGATRTLGGERHHFNAMLWSVPRDVDMEKPGAEYSAVLDMKATFTAAMRSAFGSAFQLGAGEWSAREGESIDQRGRLLNQQFTLDLHFPDTADTTALVTQTTTNIGAADPGVTFTNP